MEKESFSWGGIGFLALFILIILAFFMRGGNGWGWGNNFNGTPFGYDNGPVGYGFQNFRQICDAEKSEIVNTARTQYLVEQQASATRELVSATANTTQAKIDFYAYQDLRDKLNEVQRENMVLQNKLFVKDQLAPITAQLSSIQCNMLRRPDVTGLSTSCNPIVTPALFGLNGLNGCGCGCNNNVLV